LPIGHHLGCFEPGALMGTRSLCPGRITNSGVQEAEAEEEEERMKRRWEKRAEAASYGAVTQPKYHEK